MTKLSFGATATTAITASLFLLSACCCSVESFVLPSNNLMSSQKKRELPIANIVPPPPEGPAGSFFHPVPDDDNNDKKGDDNNEAPKDVDDQIFELIKQRKQPPKASKPSTINGVPTSKATGFGKTPAGGGSKKSSKPYVAIGPPDTPNTPINDPSKPEVDDQGYTLYTDEETGKKARVFEALVDYPCDFTMKIVGANEGFFVQEMVALVAEACEANVDGISHSVKVMGKWTSITVQAPVQSSEMLYALYEKVDQDPRVKFKF